MALVGNKCEDQERRTVLKDVALQFASEMGMKYVETSAKENINVDQIFSGLLMKSVHDIMMWRQNYHRELNDGRPYALFRHKRFMLEEMTFIKLFVFQKYGIFENISLGQFIKNKPLISDEECLINIQSEIKKKYIHNFNFVWYLGRYF